MPFYYIWFVKNYFNYFLWIVWAVFLYNALYNQYIIYTFGYPNNPFSTGFFNNPEPFVRTTEFYYVVVFIITIIICFRFNVKNKD